jgi:hypothetical protein
MDTLLLLLLSFPAAVLWFAWGCHRDTQRLIAEARAYGAVNRYAQECRADRERRDAARVKRAEDYYAAELARLRGKQGGE